MPYVNKSDVYKLFDESNGVIKLHIADVDMLPTADVVEVVRCEKCIDYLYDTPYCKKHNIGYCDRDGAIKQKNHFCGFGERRTDNDL